MIAAGCGNIQIIDSGANAIYYAGRHGHVDTLRFLHEKTCPLDVQDKVILLSLHRDTMDTTIRTHSTRYGNVDVVQYLCSIHANPDLSDREQETPLHCASWHGYSSVARTLCQAGCQVDARNREGESPLLTASARGFVDIVECLVEYGADLNSTDKDSHIALHLAVRRCQLEVVRCLLRHRCPVDHQDRHGNTPLHIACKDGNLPVVTTLCAAKATLDLPNKNNHKGSYIQALRPTSTPQPRVKLKMLGHCGCGKSSLLESLKCGILRSFFRRRRPRGNNTARHPNSPMDGKAAVSNLYPGCENVVSVSISNLYPGCENVSVRSRSMMFEPSLTKGVLEVFSPVTNALSSADDLATRAIDIQNTNINAFGGRIHSPLMVVLVGTHADVASLPRGAGGEFEYDKERPLLKELRNRFGNDLQISERLFVMDAGASTSKDVKLLRNHLLELRNNMVS
ncbi:unnamed protein product, partial [Coregonus sp. 'balchen']